MTVFSVLGRLATTLGGEGGQGVGSGFVLNGAGEIATNAHVVTEGTGSAIEKAKEVYVAFADGNEVSARIVGFDANADVALLQIDPRRADGCARCGSAPRRTCASARRSPRSGRRSASRSRCRSASCRRSTARSSR